MMFVLQSNLITLIVQYCYSHLFFKAGYQAAISWTAFMIELGVYGLLFYWTALYFGLEINWEKKSVFSKTGLRISRVLCWLKSLWGSITPKKDVSLCFSEFTYHQFNSFLKMVTIPSIWLGMLSLAWEVVTAMYKWVSAFVQVLFRHAS